MVGKGESKKKSEKVNKFKERAVKAGKKGIEASLAAGKFVKDVIEENIQEPAKEANKNTKDDSSPAPKTRKSRTTSFDISKPGSLERSIEDQIFSWYGWFWSIIAYMMVIIIAFAISASDDRFTLLPFVLLFGFPFYFFWAMYNAIPEIKIGRWTIFSKRDLSIQSQLSFTSAVARTFSRELIRNSPEGALFIGLFLLILLFTLISPFL